MLCYVSTPKLKRNDDAKLQSAGLAIRTQLAPKSFLTHSQQPLEITTSIPSTQGQLQSRINSQRETALFKSLAQLLIMQFQTFIIDFI